MMQSRMRPDLLPDTVRGRCNGVKIGQRNGGWHIRNVVEVLTMDRIEYVEVEPTPIEREHDGTCSVERLSKRGRSRDQMLAERIAAPISNCHHVTP